MKVAIVNRGVLPVPNVKGGGVETLVTYLLQQNEECHELEILLFGIEDKDIEEDKYKNTKFCLYPFQERTLFDKVRGMFKRYPLESPYSYRKVCKAIKREKADIVVLENLPWQFPIFANKFKNKVILHLHNDWINKDCSKLHRKIYRKAIKKSNKLLVVSEFMKERVCEIDNSLEHKIEVYYNATDISLYSKKVEKEERERLRRQLGINKSDIVIVYTGRICEEKGVLELMESFIPVAKKHDNVKLLIAGSVSYGETTTSSYTRKIENKIKEVESQVITTGFVPYKDMYKIYAVADIQVIPSMWEEPFGLVAIEGMAQGLPIISTKSGGLVEVLDDKCAILVNRKNIIEELRYALELLIEDEKKRVEMAQNSKKRIVEHKEFDFPEYYKTFVKILKSAEKDSNEKK